MTTIQSHTTGNAVGYTTSNNLYHRECCWIYNVQQSHTTEKAVGYTTCNNHIPQRMLLDIHLATIYTTQPHTCAHIDYLKQICSYITYKTSFVHQLSLHQHTLPPSPLAYVCAFVSATSYYVNCEPKYIFPQLLSRHRVRFSSLVWVTWQLTWAGSTTIHSTAPSLVVWVFVSVVPSFFVDIPSQVLCSSASCVSVTLSLPWTLLLPILILLHLLYLHSYIHMTILNMFAQLCTFA